MGFDRKAFAKNLRVKRAEMNISQGELADRSGISLATISQYETENFIPGIDRVVQLAESLGCSPNDLIGWGN